MAEEKKFVDWVAIEKHYRAGLKSLRTIGEEYGVTEAAIRKRAKRDLWTRSLEEKIQARAQEKVRKALVRKPGTQVTPETEKRTIEEYSTVVSTVDLRQREDVQMALDNALGMLRELVALADPKFRSMLEWMAENFDETTPAFKDRANETYRYIIDIAGRVKMAKDLAAVHGVYVPMQRKMYRLDDDDAKKSTVDDLLEAIGAPLNVTIYSKNI